MTTHPQTLILLCFFGGSSPAGVAASGESRVTRRSEIILSVVSLLLLLLGSVRSSFASSLVPQDPLDPSCIPMFVDQFAGVRTGRLGTACGCRVPS